MLNIDLSSALRRRKPAKRTSSLVPHNRAELVDLTCLPGMPLFLLLDTNVYINRAAGRFSQRVCDTIDKARCSIVRLRWRNLRAVSPTLFANIPCSRLVTPDAQVWADAGVIAGTLARSQGFQPHQRKECLNDALIFLTAAKAGIPVLTANRSEFDLIQQLAPEGQFVHC